MTSNTVTGNAVIAERGGIFNISTPGSVTLTRIKVTGNIPDNCHPGDPDLHPAKCRLTRSAGTSPHQPSGQSPGSGDPLLHRSRGPAPA
ncbi:MAG TPA: hypothetical protein VFV02_09765 [Acidimicrobiales bacterium]|nr:hypothetical protein [Acidimicrobiales bacterium]